MENGLPPIARLRAQIEGEEFDYLALLRSLQDYAYPRDKITTMLRWGDIVRVKKGIYVFGDAHARRPYSREILANMIYGPSYVSLDSALQYHALWDQAVILEGGVQRDIRRSVYHIGQDLAGVGPTRVRVTKHVDTLFDTDDVAPAKHGGYLVPRVGVILEGSKERQVIEFFSLDLSSQSCDRR